MGFIDSEHYLSDKLSGAYRTQLNNLPAGYIEILINGTENEAALLVKDLQTRERTQHQCLLGRAALEYVNDCRCIMGLRERNK